MIGARDDRFAGDPRYRSLRLRDDVPDPSREALECLNGDHAIPIYALTAREVEVLTLAAAGDTNEQIATKLGARPQTIKKHLDHVYAKLDVTGRGPAVARVLGLQRVGAPVNLQS